MLSDELKKYNKEIELKDQQEELEKEHKLKVAPEKIILKIKDKAEYQIREKKFKSYNNGKNRITVNLWTEEGLYTERTFMSEHLHGGYYIMIYPGTMEKVEMLAAKEGIQIIGWGLSTPGDVIRKRHNTKALAKDSYRNWAKPLLWIKCKIDF